MPHRTAVLGGHVESCDGCGHTRIAYNSCRNRHCPKFQAAARAWLPEKRAGMARWDRFVRALLVGKSGKMLRGRLLEATRRR